MLGKSSAFKSVPFFWAMMLGKGIRFAGMYTLNELHNKF